ncbi:MAG: malectin domain-containing carbohydrate-binding protein [Solirubrobacteraceae bacterium]
MSRARLLALVLLVLMVTAPNAGSSDARRQQSIRGRSSIPPEAPVRIAAGGQGLRDAGGRAWIADAGYVGGAAVSTGQRVVGTASPELYEHARLGMRAYLVRVPAPGAYAVVLHFAEIADATAGRRVFDVTAQGRTELRAVDIAAAAGQNTAYSLAFTTVVTDGTLHLGFIAIAGRPIVSGIDVELLSAWTGASRLLFDDEFDGPAGSPPDPRLWNDDIGGDGWGNHELEYYTGRRRNVSLDGHGQLVITAFHETYVGADGVTRHYTSARLQTYGRFAFRYGLVEARIMLPAGQGLWPAFWMLGEDAYRDHDWPRSGEIDIMEMHGNEPDVASAHLIGPLAAGAEPRGVVQDFYNPGQSVKSTSSLADAYHVYAALWLPNGVEFLLDDRPYFTITPADLPPTSHWVADRPNFLLLNLAIGGDAGSPDAGTHFPAEMKVDWVRVTSP